MICFRGATRRERPIQVLEDGSWTIGCNTVGTNVAAGI